jgi:hypothetical protein
MYESYAIAGMIVLIIAAVAACLIGWRVSKID